MQRRPTSETPLSKLVHAYQDPHGVYDAMRNVDGLSLDPSSRCWVVTAHAAVRQILSDTRFSADLSGSGGSTKRMPFVQAAIQRQVIFADDERQHRVQQVVLRESSRTMNAIVDEIRETARRLAEEARAKGEFDLVVDFALPYTMEAISLMVGVPVEQSDEMRLLAQWSTTFANITSGYLLVPIQEVDRLGEYFRTLVAARRACPAGDLISELLKEQALADEEDLVINCMMAFAAGRVTVQKLLSRGMPLLMAEWSVWRDVHAQRTGISRRLVEELLRVVTPTRYVVRRAVQDVDLSPEVPGEHHIRAGDKVVLFLEAANRDPQTFASAHCIVADRHPNAHVAFGYGSHRCPGANAARVEIQVALDALLETFVELRPHPSKEAVWDPNPNLGGYVSFPCIGK